MFIPQVIITFTFSETNPECRACQAEEREKSSDKAEDDEY